MNPGWTIIILIMAAGVVVVFISIRKINVIFTQIMWSLMFIAGIFLAGVGYYFLKDRGFNSSLIDPIKIAVPFAIEWVRENKGIELEMLDDGFATARCFPEDKEYFVGMRLNRTAYGSDMVGMPVTMVVGTTPLRIMDYEDNPNAFLLDNPFQRFAAGFSGAPTPKARPDLDPVLFQKSFDHRGRGSDVNIYSSSPIDEFKRKQNED